MPVPVSIEELESVCARVRQDILEMSHEAGAGHTGGSLSLVEILVGLYFRILRVDPRNPAWPERDRFILSKGHATPGYYAVLCARGYWDHAMLKTFDQTGSLLQGHPDMTRTPGVDMSTGSLGQGFSAAVGMAMGARALKLPCRIYVLLGDGELQEGQVWEAAQFASAKGLDNLTAIVDSNRLQLADTVDQTLSIEPFRERWASMGWYVTEANGHALPSLLAAYEEAIQVRGVPQVVRAHTVKGKGISFIENQVSWHARSPNDQEMASAMKELEKGRP